MRVSFLKTVFRPAVSDRAGVRRYVAAVTLFAWMVAASADVIEARVEGAGLSDWLFKELLTLCVVLAIAIPIARTMGFAHLELHHARSEAERLSRIDPLTGLANRRAFYAAAEHKVGAIALAIVDIDRFKRVNDQHGHAVGDATLTAVAQIMSEELSDLGLVARLGGEEFGLLSPNAESESFGERLQRFRRRIAETQVTAHGEAIEVTVSAGIAVRRNADMGALYAAADSALYVAKAAGRDRVVDFDDIGDAPGEFRLQQAS